ncbi:hypothetical protein F4804DRAFT_324666 [Jackrogersella minutella]|nr:hypothetical protein F4804DRAFT_324666 [Jackrogersella minutella]
MVATPDMLVLVLKSLLLSNVSPLNNLYDSIQQDWIACSFQGRICSRPDPGILSLNENLTQKLKDHGSFVELQYYFNLSDDQNRSDLLKKKCVYFLHLPRV